MDSGSASASEPLCARIEQERVDSVVHAFYDKLRTHSELSRFFAYVKDFAQHEQHIAVFWWWAMGGRAERQRPFDMNGRHQPLGLNERAFEQWLAIFRETLQEQLPSELAEAWFDLAQGIGANLQRMMLEGKRAFILDRL